jgi:hypothetical protein
MIYRTCGLKIRSTLELPGLARVQDDAEVVKVGRNANPEAFRKRTPVLRNLQGVEAIDLSWSRVGRFRVTDRSITIFRKHNAEDNLVRTYAVGPALAVLLHLRRFLVLHSSTVEIGGRAVAFAGDSGSGKSTLAFALGQRGYRILSDDVLVLKKTRDRWEALSGPCAPKLWPDMARFLGASSSQFERIHSRTMKRIAKPSPEVANCARPLDCIYMLSVGNSLRIDKLPLRAQFWSLVRNAYCRILANSKDAMFYLVQCGQLVRDIPVRRLYRSRSPEGINDLVELIERDQRRLRFISAPKAKQKQGSRFALRNRKGVPERVSARTTKPIRWRERGDF